MLKNVSDMFTKVIDRSVNIMIHQAVLAKGVWSFSELYLKRRLTFRKKIIRLILIMTRGYKRHVVL